MTDASEPPRGWAAWPSWARIGILALAAIVVALVAIVLVRIATRVPPIPLGVTAADDVRPGSCLAEDDRDLAEYTVVPCTDEHPQQVFAFADVEVDESVYALAGESLAVFGDEVCLHYLEYRLFLVAELEKQRYRAYAIDVPTPEEYRAGDTEALCAIAARDGGALEEDLYRAMP